MPSIRHPAAPDQTDTDPKEIILGVDTHKDSHVAAMISTIGGLLGSAPFSTTADGYRQLLSWARQHGVLQRAGVEGTGSYGAALTRYLHAEGIRVVEVNRPDRATRRRRGKTDAVDAEAAARAVLAGQATATAKTGDGSVEMARMFKLAKASAVKARTQAINQLQAVLVCAEPTLQESLSGLGSMTLIRRCAALQVVEPTDVNAAAVYTLRRLAGRIVQLTEEIRDLDKRLTAVIAACAPGLLARAGLGPDTTAAVLITIGDNRDRLASDASFAALCGASPIEASSGKTRRHRLNRGGDRQTNAALHRIVITRIRCDPRTRDYIDRHTSEGKTRREAIRCLKRYVAREIYNSLPQNTSRTAPPAATAA